MWDFSIERFVELLSIFSFWIGLLIGFILVCIVLNKITTNVRNLIKYHSQKNTEKCGYNHTNSIEKCDTDYSYLLDPDYYGD